MKVKNKVKVKVKDKWQEKKERKEKGKEKGKQKEKYREKEKEKDNGEREKETTGSARAISTWRHPPRVNDAFLSAPSLATDLGAEPVHRGAPRRGTRRRAPRDAAVDARQHEAPLVHLPREPREEAEEGRRRARHEATPHGRPRTTDADASWVNGITRAEDDSEAE